MIKIDKTVHLFKIINIVLIPIAICANIYGITQGDTIIANWISVFTTIAALVVALLYTIKGYRKEDIKLFNIFITLCIVTLFLQLGGETYYLITIGTSILKSSVISIFSIILEIILLLIILLVKEMDKKAALTFAGTIVVFITFNFIRTLAIYRELPHYIALTFSGIILACVIYVSVAAKYKNDSPQPSK